jgi:hypothetical protein
MVANATECAGCCYIAILCFRPRTLVSISNIRRLRYDGTMSWPEDLSDSLICSGPQTL